MENPLRNKQCPVCAKAYVSDSAAQRASDQGSLSRVDGASHTWFVAHSQETPRLHRSPDNPPVTSPNNPPTTSSDDTKRPNFRRGEGGSAYTFGDNRNIGDDEFLPRKTEDLQYVPPFTYVR